MDCRLSNIFCSSETKKQTRVCVCVCVCVCALCQAFLWTVIFFHLILNCNFSFTYKRPQRRQWANTGGNGPWIRHGLEKRSQHWGFSIHFAFAWAENVKCLLQKATIVWHKKRKIKSILCLDFKHWVALGAVSVYGEEKEQNIVTLFQGLLHDV